MTTDTLAQEKLDLLKLPSNLSGFKANKLSDDQIITIKNEIERRGLKESNIISLVRLRGMPESEILELKRRLTLTSGQTIFSADSLQKEDNLSEEFLGIDNYLDQRRLESEFHEEEGQIFGRSLFNAEKLSFEPNFFAATPKGYKLGVGDEIMIDVWGASQRHYQLVISPAGTVMIDRLGPIALNGLTIEHASKKIASRFSQIYAGLRGSNPNTYVEVIMGRLRSIKVSIIGEVMYPGTYTLSSLATVLNALYLSGGPSAIGSFRNIEVIRNGKVINKLDVYQLLMEGRAVGNITLQNQDIVRIPAFNSRVTITGEIKRPSIYELKNSETLKEALNYAAGFTDKAYIESILINRVTSKEKMVKRIGISDFETFVLRNGDSIYVSPVLDRYQNRVKIEGAVYREGDYELTYGLTLRQLIEQADGVRKDAFLSRGLIYRTKNEISLELVPFNLSAISEGYAEDIELEPEDVVKIFSIHDLEENYSVEIRGEIRLPGEYLFQENMTLADIILQAGGLNEQASLSHIEVARRIKTKNKNSKQIAELFSFTVNRNLNSEDGDFVLKPFDVISVRKSPSYEEQRSVVITGEVLYPGAYILENKDERISTMVKKAGGLTESAFPRGASLLRNNLKKNENIDFDLDKVLSNPGSEDDLILLPSDRIFIPQELQTVSIEGGVFSSTSMRYQASKRFKHYISGAGGYSDRARRAKSYVRYANGSVKSTKNFLFGKFHPKIYAGSTLIIPEKPEKRIITTQEAIGWTTGFATLGLIIVNIIKASSGK